MSPADPDATKPAPSIEDIPIERVRVDTSKRRTLNAAVVADLVQSIASVGLLEPIIVTPIADSEDFDFDLVAGWHRLEACKQLGHERIKARIEDMDEATREEIEIAENAVRAELSAARRASHLLRLKKIYETEHPETRKGAQGGGRDGKGTRRRLTGSAKMAFSAHEATKTGRSKRSTSREVRRAEQLGEDIDRVADTSLDSPGELDALIALAKDDRVALIERARKGEQVSAVRVLATPVLRSEPIEAPVGNNAPREEAVTVENEDGAPQDAVQRQLQSILALVARAEDAIGELLAALNKRGASGQLKELANDRRNRFATALSIVQAQVRKSLL